MFVIASAAAAFTALYAPELVYLLLLRNRSLIQAVETIVCNLNLICLTDAIYLASFGVYSYILYLVLVNFL